MPLLSFMTWPLRKLRAAALPARKSSALLGLAAMAWSQKASMALLSLTAIEVFLAYIHTPLVIMLVALIGLSIIKAALIIAYFMHLKFERFSLFLTLFPMLVFCILLLFITMPDSMRPAR